MSKSFLLPLALTVLLIFQSGCISIDDLTSFKDAQVSTKNIVNYGRFPTSEYMIRPYDLLNINLNSYETTQSTTTFINGNSSGGSTRVDAASLYVTSYTVNDRGMIRLPLIGDLKVGGLTTAQIKDLVDEKLKEHLKYSSSTVKLASFRVTLMGEINATGVYYIYNTKTNLLQVIGMAGDFTDFADRSRVKIFREHGQETEAVFLDLTKSEFLTSDYYFLQPDDVIYIEPLKAKAWSLNTKTASVFLSAISIGITVFNLVVTLQNNSTR